MFLPSLTLQPVVNTKVDFGAKRLFCRFFFLFFLVVLLFGRLAGFFIPCYFVVGLTAFLIPFLYIQQRPPMATSSFSSFLSIDLGLKSSKI